MKRTWALAAVVCLQAACSGDGGDLDPGSEQVPGSLAVALSAASVPGLAAVRLNVIGPQHDCGDRGLAEAVISVDPLAPIADATFVLPPGQFTVCLHALDGGGQTLPDCSGGGRVTIMAGATSYLATSLVCRQPRGAVSVFVDVNQAPVLESFETVPLQRFITACRLVELRVGASDPDGDPLTYTWTSTGPAPVTLFPHGPQAALFMADAGYHWLRVDISDSKGATTSLEFPIYVAPCP